MSAIPPYVRTWAQILTTGTPGLRLTYASLLGLVGSWAIGVKTLLLANTCTLLWSCDGTTGPSSSSDHTDRITTAANFAVRTAAGATATSWFIITDGNGGQLLICYAGATDDCCRISYSHTAAYVLAGTSTHIPTATDEVVLNILHTTVGNTTSADRILHGLCSADGKAYRFCVLRAAANVGVTWGVESFTPTVTAPATLPNPVYAWAWGTTNIANAVINSNASYYAAAAVPSLAGGGSGGQVRFFNSSLQFLAFCQPISWGSTVNMGMTTLALNNELQGTLGFMAWPNILMSSITVGARGVAGNLIDWWTVGPAGEMDGYGSNFNWLLHGCTLWPNPANVAPTLS